MVKGENQKGPYRDLYEQFRSGRISRREYVNRSSELTVGMPITLFILNAMSLVSRNQNMREVVKDNTIFPPSHGELLSLPVSQLEPRKGEDLLPSLTHLIDPIL